MNKKQFLRLSCASIHPILVQHIDVSAKRWKQVQKKESCIRQQGGPLEERPPASLSGTASTRHTRQHGTTKKCGAKVHASGETEGWDENT